MPLMTMNPSTDLEHDALTAETSTQHVSLGDLFLTFTKIGCISFGGFMALISVIADTIVEKRKLLTHNDMLDGISLANLLPGPQGVNCVAYIGYRLRGGLGALVSAIGVLLPTMGLMMGLTSLYLAYASQLPGLGNFFAGLVPAVAAIMVSVVHRMSGNVLKGRREWVMAGLAVGAMMIAPKAIRLYVTFGLVGGFGLAGYLMFRPALQALQPRVASLPWRRLGIPLAALGLIVVTFLAQPELEPNGLLQIALTFSGLSLMLFGGGYVFIPMIQDVVVANYAWLSTQQFLDGVAFSQVTPGPIVVIATFISQKVIAEQYGLVMGLVGAVVGTAAIFAPPAILMVTASLALEDLKQSPGVQAAMRGIRCGILGMIVVAALVILRTTLPDWPHAISVSTIVPYLSLLWPTVLIFAVSLVSVIKCRIDVVWVIPVAGACGLFLY